MKMGEGGQVEDFVLLRVGVLDSGGVNQQLACMAFHTCQWPTLLPDSNVSSFSQQ